MQHDDDDDDVVIHDDDDDYDDGDDAYDDDPQVPQQPLPVSRGPGGAGAGSGAGRESGQHLVPEPEVTLAQLARHAGAHLAC